MRFLERESLAMSFGHSVSILSQERHTPRTRRSAVAERPRDVSCQCNLNVLKCSFVNCTFCIVILCCNIFMYLLFVLFYVIMHVCRREAARCFVSV